MLELMFELIQDVLIEPAHNDASINKNLHKFGAIDFGDLNSQICFDFGHMPVVVV
jgi:hypothetical protein